MDYQRLVVHVIRPKERQYTIGQVVIRNSDTFNGSSSMINSSKKKSTSEKSWKIITPSVRAKSKLGISKPLSFFLSYVFFIVTLSLF